MQYAQTESHYSPVLQDMEYVGKRKTEDESVDEKSSKG